jgi:chromosome segregation ATPase
MDKYIALQAQEEELDSGICDAENERSDIAAQIVGLQARLNEAEETKSELMRETHNIRAEKKRLQSSLDLEEQLEFGFEAGRKMESKRVKMARGGRRSGRAWSSFWVR